MRKFLVSNTQIFQRLDNVERKLLVYDNNFEKVFSALETQEPKKGIFLMVRFLILTNLSQI